MNTKTAVVVIGNLNANLVSDIIDGEVMDTSVKIESGTLCFVSGAERFQLISDLNEVINKYRI
jgi:hypothetical protein